MEIIYCPYCGTTHHGTAFARKRTWDGIERYFDPNYSIYRCETCDLVYSASVTSDTVANLRRYYSETYNDSRGSAPPEQAVANAWADDAIRRLARPIINRLHVIAWRFSTQPKDFGSGRAPEALSILHARRARTVLDVGCAAGGFVRFAGTMGMTAYGIEPDVRLVEAMHQRGIQQVTTGFFPEESGPLPRYDALTFFAVLMYMPVISPMLFRACRDLLGSHGTMIVFEPDMNTINESAGTLQSPLTRNFFSAEFMRRAASDAGFTTYKCVPCRGEPLFCFHVLAVGGLAGATGSA